jgi:glyoxylase-like metal-dependent hydrolase (beta-lactamase superfamily II)/rhodanese-related sulfurtransferase
VSTIDPSTALTSPSEVPLGERLTGLPDEVVIRQLYLGCLSQASYLVGDATSGRAIAVDPRRDIDELLEAAELEGLTIELIVQTHFHADFLSGHLELAAATGAAIAYGSVAETEFASRKLADREVLDLGGASIEVLHTPGHTPESISLVVRGAGGEPVAVLTGDTLFIGDVGRPDLLVSAGVSADDLGSRLYRSVHRLLELPDDVLVLPAHGAGSACGKALSTETVSTIGAQRRENYAVQPMSEEAFVALVTEDQPAAPGYFGHAAALNREERPLLHEDPVPELDLAGIDAAVATGAVVVDVRPVEDVAAGHLAGSLNVGLGGRFAEQVGSIVPVDRPLVLVGSAEAVHEARVRLARIGFDDVVGQVTAIDAVLADRPDRAAQLSRLTATGFAEREAELGDRLVLIDVRNPGEVRDAPVPGARAIPLARLRGEAPSLDPTQPTVLVCAGGARSAIGVTLLRSLGFDDVSDVLGGATALGIGAACSLSSAATPVSPAP